MTDSLSMIHRMIDDTAKKPGNQVEEIYRSSNGDLWQLVRAPADNRCVVRHTPNTASGGSASEMSVEEFLMRNGSGPETAALRLLIGNGPAA